MYTISKKTQVFSTPNETRLEEQHFPEPINVLKTTRIFKSYFRMVQRISYKVLLYNPALLINEMILFGDTLLNMSFDVTLLSNKINLKISH